MNDMKKTFYSIGLAVWGLSSMASSQTLTLEQAIHAVWDNSIQLKVQKSLAGIYSDDTWRRWIPQEPTLSWTDNYSDTYWTWGLSLTYPFPVKSAFMSQLDSAMAESQRWEYTAQKYDLAVSITQAYMAGATAQAMMYFEKQNVQDLETITDAIRNQYVHGQSNQVNKISAELQLTAAQRDLKTAEDQLENAVELYSRLMGIPKDQVTGFVLPEDLPSSIIDELGHKTSAQLRDRYNEDVGEATRATGFWNQFPDPTFSVSKDYYPAPNYPDSPTGLPNDYNFAISFTIPILFPFREMAEAQRSENQGTDAREMSRFNVVQDNLAQEAGAQDYLRSKSRFNQLHSRDLLLAQTMMEAALEAYKRGQFEFTALMLAHQTYAAVKTEDIQIRAEIVNARLTGLVGDEEAPVGGKTDWSSNLPNTDTYMPVTLVPMGTQKIPPEGKTHYSNNPNPENYQGDLDTTGQEKSETPRLPETGVPLLEPALPAPSNTKSNPDMGTGSTPINAPDTASGASGSTRMGGEAAPLGASAPMTMEMEATPVPTASEGSKDSNSTSQANPAPSPTAGTDNGDGSTEQK